jgi:hypothetical protein
MFEVNAISYQSVANRQSPISAVSAVIVRNPVRTNLSHPSDYAGKVLNLAFQFH